MTPNRSDRDHDADLVRAALAELRLEDDARVPRFADVLSRRPAAGRTVRSKSVVPRLGLAAAVIVAALLGYVTVTKGKQPLTLPTEVAGLSSWRPVTDALLETPGRNLLREASPLGASVINLINVNVTGDFR